MLSVIIPSRNRPDWIYTKKTVDDLFEKATGDIEVIVIMDGYQLAVPLTPRPNLTVIHHPTALGMRPTINEGVHLAKGKYIMKCDDHCMFAKGFDVALAADCDDNWLAVPSRYSLDGEKWSRKYGPICYLYLTYPFNLDNQFGFGFHGKKWHGEHGFTGGYFHLEEKRKKILIDDILSFQGSCWFMCKDYFNKIGQMQQEGYLDHQEAQELLHKVYLSGGRCVVNKNTWYAHLHKGAELGRGYHLLKQNVIRSNIYSCDVWMNNRWEGQIKPFKSLIENPSWWPLENWPEDWDSKQRIENYDYSIWHKGRDFQIKYKSDYIHVDDLNRYLKEDK